MKILLVNPPGIVVPGATDKFDAAQPLGLAYLASALERTGGVEVYVYDAYMGGVFTIPGISRIFLNGQEPGDPFPESSLSVGDSFEMIRNVFLSVSPDVVGVSVLFSDLHHMGLRVAALAREADPTVVTVLGGNHPSIAARAVLASPDVDFVIKGEGEESFPALVGALARGLPPGGIPGLCRRLPDGGIEEGDFAVVEDLDSLAWPARQRLPMEHYFSMPQGRIAFVSTSRGCPFGCTFCTVPQGGGRRWRARSVPDVVGEVESLVDDFRVEGLFFVDDNLTVDKARATALFEAIRPLGLDLSALNLMVSALDGDLLASMRRAGFRRVSVAVESGSDRVLREEMKKPVTVARSLDVVRQALGLGMDVTALFVIGMPGETRDELGATVRLAHRMKEMGVTSFWVSVATPLAGTELHGRAVREGLIPPGEVPTNSFDQGMLDTPHFDRHELSDLRRAMMVDLNS